MDITVNNQVTKWYYNSLLREPEQFTGHISGQYVLITEGNGIQLIKPVVEMFDTPEAAIDNQLVMRQRQILETQEEMSYLRAVRAKFSTEE
jgi:hypothetical protein